MTQKVPCGCFGIINRGGTKKSKAERQGSTHSDGEAEHAIPESGDSVAKKPGLLERLRPRQRKEKFRSVSSVGDGTDEGQRQRKKKISFGFGSRSRSQPDLYRDKPTSVENESVKNVPNTLDILAPGSPARLKLASKRDDNARLTPVVETPSEDDRRRSSPDINHTKPLFKLYEGGDGTTGFNEDDAMPTDMEKAARPKMAAFVPPRPNDTGLNRALPAAVGALKEQRTVDAPDQALPMDSTAVNGNVLQSELVGDAPKKKVPPPLTRGQSSSRLQSQSWINSVTIFLFEGKDLPAMDRNGLSDPFCKFRLGSAKYKTRVAYKTLNPQWMEQFDLYICDPDDRTVEITVWDWDRGMRNDYIGKCMIDLSLIETEKMCDMWVDVRNETSEMCGSLHLSLLISGGKMTADKIEDDTNSPVEEAVGGGMHRTAMLERYDWKKSLTDIGDVGMLTVKVFRGCSLRAADLNGKSDPYCILQLVNARLQTQVEPKTLDPEWNRVFTFPVNDVHSALDITVMDMDQDKKSDFLGRVAIPLLRIQNNERRWYALKDQKLQGRAKGAILLEMEMIYNPLRAAFRTLHPKEVCFDRQESKFKTQVFVRNITRLKSIMLPVLEFGHFLQSCFNWESRARSMTVFISYLLIVYFFQMWMIPAGLLGIFLMYYIKQHFLASTYTRDPRDEELADYLDQKLDSDDEDEDNVRSSYFSGSGGNKTANVTLMTRMRVAQEQLKVVQNLMGFVGDLAERISNTFHFTVPWISYLVIILLTVASVILYFIPLRLLLLIWGVNKFTKKLRNPNAASNNELLDLLSRVHTNDESKMYKELRPRDVPNQAAVHVGMAADGTIMREQGTRRE
ncbi:multiple C2 and transmembrane domain-containing protein 1-like isoform X2 [Paramacrobiotus metropolitanus]|uniref:multiple C2 and transmembrane domain-containing protein 1-like isoform X2 n=1 Tax=Paramacrobiotus metropolitanus TaxID=2943436 RepID=UPI00244645A0|nr:multiple C2 and transmembrane domain-containing protein 1-like isoform X2 [Paramacrobiotus metropolitanus]